MTAATHEELRIVAAAHSAPGGPVWFVRQFLHAVWTGQLDQARHSLDPQYEWSPLGDLRLGDLRDGRWHVSGLPRVVTEDGAELVLFVFLEGTNRGKLIERPTQLPAVEFTLRRTDREGWLIERIASYRRLEGSIPGPTRTIPGQGEPIRMRTRSIEEKFKFLFDGGPVEKVYRCQRG